MNRSIEKIFRYDSMPSGCPMLVPVEVKLFRQLRAFRQVDEMHAEAVGHFGKFAACQMSVVNWQIRIDLQLFDCRRVEQNYRDAVSTR